MKVIFIIIFRGVLKIAEVTSRIKDKAEFTKSLSRLGFKLESEVCASV